MKHTRKKYDAPKAKMFRISDKAVRMDNKLIGSNIAWHPRYELTHKPAYEVSGEDVGLDTRTSEVHVATLMETLSQTVHVLEISLSCRRLRPVLATGIWKC